jgi:tetratricopeptide (TPR) repeat protein
LDLATALLCLPLLGGTYQPESFSQLLDGYRERSAADTAVATLRGLSEFTLNERPIANFLLANDLAELGLSDLAAAEFGALLDHPHLAPAAFLGLARLQTDPSGAATLLREARRAPWGRMDGDDFAEAAFRVARASFVAGRYPEARSWLTQIPESSAYFPFSRYLLAQTEYALDRYGKAIEAADTVFQVRSPGGSSRWLQDRTAILVGDMLTEIGLYPDAIGVLDWPEADSPFRGRAELDAGSARSLAEIEAGASDREAAAEESVEETLTGQDLAIAAAANQLSARASDLVRTWPPRELGRARRRAAWAAAAKAHERSRGFDWRRPLEILWYSFPPVILARILGRPPERRADVESTVGADTRFFFTPEGEVAKLLTAVALASEAPRGDGCAERAARHLRLRAAGALAGFADPVASEEIRAIATGCGGEDSPDPLPALSEKLRTALAVEASRLRRDVRSRQALFTQAVAEARRRREAAMRAAGELR